MGPGGALEAAIEARAQGLARFIGVTGHGWTIAAMHRRSLARFDFDSVLLPYNYFMAQDERYRHSFEELLATCRERRVAVQVIKSVARGPWATTERSHTTWYQPLEDQGDIDRAVHWALDVPGAFLNTAGDLALLPRVLDAASRFTAPAAGRDDGDDARVHPDDVAVRPPQLSGPRSLARAEPPGAGAADGPAAHLPSRARPPARHVHAAPSLGSASAIGRLRAEPSPGPRERSRGKLGRQSRRVLRRQSPARRRAGPRPARARSCAGTRAAALAGRGA